MALGRRALVALLAVTISGAAWSADAKTKVSKTQPAESNTVSPAAKAPLEATSTKVIAPPADSKAPAGEADHEQAAPDKAADTAKDQNGETDKSKAGAAPPPLPVTWTEQEVADAKARCTVLLKGVEAVTIPEPALRAGECGAPAPVRLIALGRSPEVVFSPPPLLTCEMVAALNTWSKRDLQRLAKRHLGAEIIRIETMSDYSCRNAYGRKLSKLSEHGRANALDIRGFVTARGQLAYVLEGWGETNRDVAARLAAEKDKAEKAAAELAAKATAGTAAATAATGSTSAAPMTTGAAPALSKSIVEGVQGPSLRGPALGLTEPPMRLGGPEDKVEKTVKIKEKVKPGSSEPAKPSGPPSKVNVETLAKPKVAAMTKFLKEAHASACQIFGTTLGPEANNAHRNHFHVDMAPRKAKKFCE